MSIPQEIKAKIFALYYGEDVYCTNDGYKGRLFYDRLMPMQREHAFLELKPISEITDEDASYIASIPFPGTELTRLKIGDFYTYFRKKEWEEVEFSISHDGEYIKSHFFNELYYLSSKMADYLRSRGYALPAYGYSIEDLIDEGVFKLIEK